MKPRLVSVSGTQPAEMALGEADLTIGRDASNSIHLDDPAVSSRHCVIVRDRGRFIVRDRDSTNGTFVNGRATTQADLKPGDEIQVGHIRFYFLVEEGSIPLAPAVTIEDREAESLISSETVQVDPLNSFFLRRNPGLEDSALQRRAKDLSVLVRLNAELHDIPDTETLQKTLLERIFSG
jgi:pSer/pThr/pTyr-binding forkhead associated (FHA) protein